MTWRTRASRTVYENPWIHVREDDVTGPHGDGIYGVVRMKNAAVFVVALDDEDRVVLVAVDRYTVGLSYEVPAGGLGRRGSARRRATELREETGLDAAEWTALGRMNALNGIADAPEFVFSPGASPRPSTRRSVSSRKASGRSRASCSPTHSR
jgi:hypothetical protein